MPGPQWYIHLCWRVLFVARCIPRRHHLGSDHDTRSLCAHLLEFTRGANGHGPVPTRFNPLWVASIRLKKHVARFMPNTHLRLVPPVGAYNILDKPMERCLGRLPATSYAYER